KAREIFLPLARVQGYPEGFHGLAAVLSSLDLATEATHIMDRVAASCPKDPLVQVNRGMALARAGGSRDLAEAAIAAKRALSLDPGFAPAHTCLGVVAFREGRLEAAASHLADAARLADPAGHRNLGLLACATGRVHEAENRLGIATRTDPHDAPAWAGLGALALAAGKQGDALLHLRRAAALDPHDTGIARGLAIALAKGGDTAGAEEVLRKAIDLAPTAGRGVLLLELAALLLPSGGRAGNHVLDEEARLVLQEAHSLRPGDPGVLFYEGIAAARLGNVREAIDRFTGSMGSDRYRGPAHENIRRVRERSRPWSRVPPWVSPARSILAILSLLQLAALWLFFVARLVSETGFVILIAVLSGLFALAMLSPARDGADGKEPQLDLVVPERNYLPGPEAEMASPLIRLRTALRH
ncbi:MAG TPA: tetratricopeptide repeat protein, partial [Methanomicrobiales archaeon]|nr:tetratricopeptide repeat protein [Methanomicrobiales archaeon]